MAHHWPSVNTECSTLEYLLLQFGALQRKASLKYLNNKNHRENLLYSRVLHTNNISFVQCLVVYCLPIHLTYAAQFGVTLVIYELLKFYRKR